MVVNINIIPQPAQIQFRDSGLHLSERFRISTESENPEIMSLLNLFREELYQCLNVMPAVSVVNSGSADPGGIIVRLENKSELTSEGSYWLEAKGDRILVEAGTQAGLFYGLQSVLQMLYGSLHQIGEASLPGMLIMDRPRFGWRGMHLDVSRHFLPVEFIKKYISLLAMHKMNVFHWHLTDDQGWRIELKKYPRLTEIGAWREEADGHLYGGYYTQSEVREIVEYAAQRFVTVVPEIEMPGHATAALAAYPEYSCSGGPFRVASQWGVFDDVFCPGRDSTFAFLQDILTEISALFPGPYVHIGGDECPKDRWHSHDLCQIRMKQMNLENEDQLQAWFISRIAGMLNSLGKSLVGWDEILEGGTPPGAVIMAWRDLQKGLEAARCGHDVIMTPMSHCYFDHYQAQDNEPKAIGGFTPLEKVYAFEPISNELPAHLKTHVLGAQGNVWTEYMPDEKHLEYMVFPRLCALSEVLWSPAASRSLPDFLNRLREHLNWLDKFRVNYRPLSD